MPVVGKLQILLSLVEPSGICCSKDIVQLFYHTESLHAKYLLASFPSEHLPAQS